MKNLKHLMLGRGRRPGLALPLLMLALVLGLKFGSDFYFWWTLDGPPSTATERLFITETQEITGQK